MDQYWEIIGIAIAILMVVFGLRLLLRKPQEELSVKLEEWQIDETTKKPIMPRHARAGLLDDSKAEIPVETALSSDSGSKHATQQNHAELASKQENEEEKKSNTQAEVLTKTAENSKKTTAKIHQQTEEAAETSLEMKPLNLADENWANETNVFDAHLSEQDRSDEESALATAQTIVALYVYPNVERALSGERTLKMLIKYGLRYGELSCFHRYEKADQASPLMFSVLRVNENGEPTGFDLEALPTEQVKGLAFFLALPNSHAAQGFDTMVSIAGLIARDTEGRVYDENNMELTPQLRDHWRHFVIEYDPNHA